MSKSTTVSKSTTTSSFFDVFYDIPHPPVPNPVPFAKTALIQHFVVAFRRKGATHWNYIGDYLSVAEAKKMRDQILEDHANEAEVWLLQPVR